MTVFAASSTLSENVLQTCPSWMYSNIGFSHLFLGLAVQLEAKIFLNLQILSSCAP